MKVPVMLDLFCCAGGAAVGYNRAGCEVYGNDNVARPNYPFPMYRGDAILDVLDTLLAGGYVGFRAKNGDIIPLGAEDIDAAHGSPPCQGEGTLAKGTNDNEDDHPHLIGDTRDRLDKLGIPYVIENVPGSSVRKDLKLWGPHFDLGVLQPRFFELGNWSVEQPKLKPKQGLVRGYNHGKLQDGPYVQVYGKGGGKATIAEAQKAKGIDWTDDWVELCEAIPPAYTEWIGRKLIEHLSLSGWPVNIGS